MKTTKGGPTGPPFVMPVKLTRSKNEFGLTLIELMIVVAIIGILAAVALPKFAQLIEKSREAATKGNLGALRSAVFIYYGDHEGVQPDTLDTSVNYSFSNYMEQILPVKRRGNRDTGTIQRNRYGTMVGRVVKRSAPNDFDKPVVRFAYPAATR